MLRCSQEKLNIDLQSPVYAKEMRRSQQQKEMPLCQLYKKGPHAEPERSGERAKVLGNKNRTSMGRLCKDNVQGAEQAVYTV